MKEFKYSVVSLIEYVRDRPCLWDKKLDSYKDRIERRVAWEEIFNLMEDNYENMTAEDKRITGEQIINKWTNIRDTFVKTLRVKNGKPKKRYMLYQHLKFLAKDMPEEANQDFNNPPPEDSITLEDEATEPVSYTSRKRSKQKDFDDLKSYDDEDYTPKKKPKRHSFDDMNHSKRLPRRSPRIMFESDSVDDNDNGDEQVDETNDPRVMNEDEAFFASLLPTVVRYSEDQRLEFRIEVLGVMKKINDRAKHDIL